MRRATCETGFTGGISERSVPPLPPALVSNDIGEFLYIAAPPFSRFRFRFRMRGARIFHEAFVTSRSRGIIFRPPNVRKLALHRQRFSTSLKISGNRSSRRYGGGRRLCWVATSSSCGCSSYRHEYCITPATCSKSDSSVCYSAIAIMCRTEIAIQWNSRLFRYREKKLLYGEEKEEWIKNNVINEAIWKRRFQSRWEREREKHLSAR